MRPLFTISADTAGRYVYDVSPDGRRFLVSALTERQTIPPFTVVLNWTAGLQK